MWKLLIIVVVFLLTKANGGPLETGQSTAIPSNKSNFNTTTNEETCRCPSPSNSSPRPVELPTIGNRPVSSGVIGTPGNINSMQNLIFHGMPCVCSLGPSRIPIRDDYRYTPGVGSHKLHTRALPWNEARKVCNDEGGHLAIVNSIAEASVLIEMFNNSGPIKGAAYGHVAYLGIHDLYKEGEWVTITGESLAHTGYTKWTDKWGGQPDNGEGKQHCGVFYKEGGLDDVYCEAAFAYFCEQPTIQFL